MCLLMLFCYSKPRFHQLGSFRLIKTMLKSLNVCKVYLQCGIVIQRVVTKHVLPSVQLSQMMNLKIGFAKNKCLGTIWSTGMNQIAWTYPAREHYKNAYFLWLYNLTPTWILTNFHEHNFDAWLQKTCDAAVTDIPLHWYKLNWPITCDFPESWTVLSGAFLFLSGIFLSKIWDKISKTTPTYEPPFQKSWISPSLPYAYWPSVH